MRALDSEIAKKCRSRAQAGAINITLSVLLLFVLATTAGIALSSADRAMLGAQSYTRHTAAILLAEGAIEEAMAHLDTIEDWSTFTLPVMNFTQPHAMGRGIIWSELGNDAADKGGEVDTNRTILIRGYGRFMGSEPIKGIEVLYWRPSLEVPPVAGLNICGVDTLDSGNGNITIDGYNHFLPTSPCSGAGCNAVRNNLSPDVAGVALERNAPSSTSPDDDDNCDNNDDDHDDDNHHGHDDDDDDDNDDSSIEDPYIILPRTVLGVPPVQYSSCRLQGEDGVCARARFLMRNLPRVVGVETLTTWPVNGKASYGSVSAPKVIRVAKGTTLKLSGTTQGAGILLVEGKLDQVGTFTWTGVIIVGPGAIMDMRGTANVFGSIVTAGSEAAPATLGLRGSGSVSWAGDAVQIGPIRMPGIVSSWREFSIPEGGF